MPVYSIIFKFSSDPSYTKVFATHGHPFFIEGPHVTNTQHCPESITLAAYPHENRKREETCVQKVGQMFSFLLGASVTFSV